MNKIIHTTPKKITKEIEQLCQQLDPSQEACFVPVKPPPYCRLLDCFFNVPEKIKRDGGQMQIGWTIWEMQNVLVEAEFHAVWKSPDGHLVDITPKQDGENIILFHPDSKRCYNREPVDNIRYPLQDHPAIHEFIKLQEERATLMRKHIVRKAAPGGSWLKIPSDEIMRIQIRMVELQPVLIKLNHGG